MQTDPILISLKHGYIPGKNGDFKVVKKNILDGKLAANKKSNLNCAPKKPTDMASVQNEAKVDEILKEIKSIKETTCSQDECISKLEQQLAKMAARGSPTSTEGGCSSWAHSQPGRAERETLPFGDIPCQICQAVIGHIPVRTLPDLKAELFLREL
jgi:hypothetical protein